MNETDKYIKMKIQHVKTETKALNNVIEKEYLGRLARITCPKYNGQIYGGSKPKLKGRVVKITEAWFISESYGGVILQAELQSLKDPCDWIWLDDSLRQDQVELIDDNQTKGE